MQRTNQKWSNKPISLLHEKEEANNCLLLVANTKDGTL